MKQVLYKIKEEIVNLFAYPTSRLEHYTVDYDEYWMDKRGDSLGKLSSWQKQRADIALRYMKDTPLASVVDVGCGDGSVLAYLKNKEAAGKIIGVDVSSTALVKARLQGVETILVDKNFTEGIDVIPDCDYVLLLEVLEHMPEAENFLTSMLEKSKHGVFFSFPNTGYIFHRLRLLFGRFPLQWRLHPSEHTRFWTYRDLLWWLKVLGYKNYKIHTYEGIPFLNKILPSVFAKGLFVYLPKDQS